MSWHNLSEKEFDAKIKSHVEGVEVPFYSKAWDKMNHKLERAFPAAKGTNNGSSWGLLSLILILAGLFFWTVGHYSGYSQQPGKEQKLNQSNNTTNNSQQSISDNAGNSESSNDGRSHADSKSSSTTSGHENADLAIQQSATKPGITESRPSTDRQISNQGLVLDNNDPQQDVHRESFNQNSGDTPKRAISSTLVSRNSKQTASFADQHAGNKGSAKPQDIIPADPDPGSIGLDNEEAKLASAARGGAVATAGTYYGRLDRRNTLGADLVWMKATQASLILEKQPQEIQDPPIVPLPSSRWSLGIGYAPDLSLVGFSELTSPGTNVAISLDYRISDRWSIQTGAIIAKKKYIAKGEDYNPPAGFWAYGVSPDKTDATCNVIDIPLSVRYYFKENRFHRFYASTGFSTYLMIREDYDYSYEKNYPSLTQNWYVRNQNQHLFGVYNLSIGYQRALSDKWSLEVEPFIKAPISGIGFGRVNLWSTGTLFSVRFKLP